MLSEIGYEPSPNFDRGELELYLMISGYKSGSFSELGNFVIELELLALLASLYKSEP